MCTHRRLEIRLKDDSTLHSILSLLQREQAAEGACTMSHRSCFFVRLRTQNQSSRALTFCCLHSLQARRLPPLRFRAIGCCDFSSRLGGGGGAAAAATAVVRIVSTPTSSLIAIARLKSGFICSNICGAP